MMTVHGGPPENAALRRRLTQECDHELKHPARLVGSMTEIPMVSRSDRPHTDDVEYDRNDERLDGNPGPYRGQAHEVGQDEGNRRRIYDVVVRGVIVSQARLRTQGLINTAGRAQARKIIGAR